MATEDGYLLGEMCIAYNVSVHGCVIYLNMFSCR